MRDNKKIKPIKSNEIFEIENKINIEININMYMNCIKKFKLPLDK